MPLGPAYELKDLTFFNGNILVGAPFENTWVEGTYAIGDHVVMNGVRYICNTAGSQVGEFEDQLVLSLWDVASYDQNDILTDSASEVVVDNDGNVVLLGGLA